MNTIKVYKNTKIKLVSYNVPQHSTFFPKHKKCASCGNIKFISVFI